MLLPLPAPAGPRPRKSKLRSTPSTNAKLTRSIQSIIVGLVEICLADSNWAEKCLEHYHRCWLGRTSLPSLTPAKSDGKPSYRIGKRHPAACLWWSNLSRTLQDAGFTYQQVTYLSITTHCRVVNRLLVDHYSAGIASTFILAGFNPWGIHRSDKITGINQSRWQIPNDLVCLVQCGSWSLWCSLVCDWIFSGGVGLHWYAQSVQLSALFLLSKGVGLTPYTRSMSSVWNYINQCTPENLMSLREAADNLVLVSSFTFHCLRTSRLATVTDTEPKFPFVTLRWP